MANDLADRVQQVTPEMTAQVLDEEPGCRHQRCEQPSERVAPVVGWSEREREGLTVAQWQARKNLQALCGRHHNAALAAESYRVHSALARAAREEQGAREAAYYKRNGGH